MALSGHLGQPPWQDMDWGWGSPGGLAPCPFPPGRTYIPSGVGGTALGSLISGDWGGTEPPALCCGHPTCHPKGLGSGHPPAATCPLALSRPPGTLKPAVEGKVFGNPRRGARRGPAGLGSRGSRVLLAAALGSRPFFSRTCLGSEQGIYIYFFFHQISSLAPQMVAGP